MNKAIDKICESKFVFLSSHESINDASISSKHSSINAILSSNNDMSSNSLNI
jgi:hypothetical protein